MKRFLFGILAFLLVMPVTAQPAPDADRPTNVILMIPDGYGPASGTMARDYLRWKTGDVSTTLALDSLHQGSVRTFATDSRITDSAAGATAYATGVKTYNGAIAMDTTQQPIATLLEAAERRGMSTGLVATSRITHATPASFSVHFPDRWMENAIAADQITAGVDVMLGGGRRHFLPQSADDSRRKDGRHLIEEAQQDGYTYVDSRDGLMNASGTPLLGLFASSHMDYEIDRNPEAQPSLAEMTSKTLDLLSKDDDGFFVMIEGSRIDHAGHSNDAAAHLHDILAYNEAVATALDFARRDGNTLVISVSDHETGGMSLARERDGDGLYAWHPDVLDRVRASHGVILDSLRTARKVSQAKGSSREDVVTSFRPILKHFTGMEDLTDEEQARLRAADGSGRATEDVLADIISRRTLVGWTTGGHTAVDVNLYAYGPGSDRFVGNRDNTYVGLTLADLLQFDLQALTQQMRQRTDASAPAAAGSR